MKQASRPGWGTPAAQAEEGREAAGGDESIDAIHKAAVARNKMPQIFSPETPLHPGFEEIAALRIPPLGQGRGRTGPDPGRSASSCVNCAATARKPRPISAPARMPTPVPDQVFEGEIAAEFGAADQPPGEIGASIGAPDDGEKPADSPAAEGKGAAQRQHGKSARPRKRPQAPTIGAALGRPGKR